MATKKKMLQAAAGNAGGEALNVEDVFSTYLYEGNGTSQTITNGIDLDGEGGMVWLKARSVGNWHGLYDTERGINKFLATNVTNAQISAANLLTSFNSDGFTIGATENSNFSGETATSWTFRKAPKFFDVVTYTGDGVAGRQIAHNLGSVPGMIIVKGTSNSGDWSVYHRGLSNPTGNRLQLNSTDAEIQGRWNNTAPTSTEFTLNDSLGVNGNGRTFVAYLFAHNDGDGEFGPDGDADIIKCGSAVCDSNGFFTASVGFEPQWVLVKGATVTSDWQIVDTMRGMTVGTGYPTPSPGPGASLFPNTSGAETTSDYTAKPMADGFEFLNGSSSQTYIYIAIRRGTKVPESGDEVFAIDTQSQSSAPFAISNFPVDLGIRKDVDGSSTDVFTRMLGANLLTANTTDAITSDNVAYFDYMDGYLKSTTQDNTRYNWMWKRAPNFFDVVAYTGDGTNPRTVAHNLGVAPELIWIKSRDNARSWTSSIPTGSGISTTQRLILNSTTGAVSQAYFPSQPTATEFSIISDPDINANGENYIAYLFASLDGVSKVGSWSGTGGTNTQVIDCGFSAGARFVLIKRTNASQDWLVFDTVRGITSGNDAKLALNSTAAESTINWGINPNSSGFEVTGNSINETGGEWIFYAIA